MIRCYLGYVLCWRGYVLITRKYMKKKGSCLDAWYSVFNRLKSGFSRVGFGPILIDNSCPPSLFRSLFLRYVLLAHHVPCHVCECLMRLLCAYMHSHALRNPSCAYYALINPLPALDPCMTHSDPLACLSSCSLFLFCIGLHLGLLG